MRATAEAVEEVLEPKDGGIE